jgi:predicted  nucleic acid-binding Zn-ribbon protein
MLQELTQLLQVQERDQRMTKLKRDLRDIPTLQARAKDQLAGDQADCDAALAAMREVELKIKTIELDAQTRRNTIVRLKEQQFNTRKNDEFQALGNEAIRYEKEVSAIEDKQLDMMEKLEGAKALLKEAQAKLATTQAHVNEELKALEERGVNITDRIAELKTERAELRQPIAPETIEIYDRLMKGKNNAAIVVAENGTCGGCHMKLVTHTLHSLKANQGFTYCEQCGRILYFA